MAIYNIHNIKYLIKINVKFDGWHQERSQLGTVKNASVLYISRTLTNCHNFYFVWRIFFAIFQETIESGEFI